MGLNKQVSVWRGNNTPPTDYHLWIKENGDILIKILDNWSTVANVTNLGDISTLKEDLSTTKTDLGELKLNVEGLKIQEVEAETPNTLKSYSLIYNGESKGIINIPKDRFLKNVLYDLTTKKLIFTFIISDGTETTLEISVADLVDVYKAGNNVTIKDNTISVDFSHITLALNTKVNKSDFDYVVKVNDDNKGNIINAKLVVNNQTTGVSNNYDLILGDKDNNDSYIQIDSTRSKNPADLNKFGNITTYSPNSLHLIGRNNTNITGDCVYIKDKNDELFNWRMSFDDGFNMLCSGGDWMQFNNYDGLSVNSSYPTVFNDRGFQINSSTSNENGYDFRGYLSFKGEGFEIHCAEKEKSSTCFIKAQLDNAQNNNYGEDKLQFLDKSVEITPTKFKALDGTVQIEKGKNIKLKTSSSNTMRLTEGEGFKVFANMYAEPDHATDITDYTDEEKALLSSNTVQKILLDTTKALNLKADSSTLNNYVLLNNVDAELSETSVNPVLNKTVKAAVYSLNQETSTLSQKLNNKADSSSLNNYLPLTGGTISNSLNVTGTLTAGGKTVLTSHQPIYKLTLLKNGSNVGTFTPTDSDSTLNISVPTKLSELTDDVVNGKYLSLSGGTITNNLIVNGKITQGGNSILDISTTNITDLTIKINNVSRTIPVKLSELTNDIVEACTTDEINALFE